MGTYPKICKKRDGSTEPFDLERIASAIYRAFAASGEGNKNVAGKIAYTVVDKIVKENVKEPQIEYIQDLVEEALMEAGYKATAKKYILYRDQHAQKRD